MVNGTRTRRVGARSTLALAVLLVVGAGVAASHPSCAWGAGRWLAGDLSTSTFLTDGKTSERVIVAKVMAGDPSGFGLDYLANAEPGGRSTRNAAGVRFATPVWRWQTLIFQSFPQIVAARAAHRGDDFIQGLQWDAPTLGQVTVGIVGAVSEPQAIADFEYRFDAADTDTSRSDVSKANTTAHDAILGVSCLQKHLAADSYAFVDHPSRDLAWTVGDLRALQDAAPSVVCGFEGFPGDQAAAARGGYGDYFDASGHEVSDPGAADPAETALARTYGGADPMVARVGGVWDALLGEGRRWFVYGDSDFKWWTTRYKDQSGRVVGASYCGFWPGQYDKTWTYVPENGYRGLVAAIKSGDSFIVNGDLIDALDFHIALGRTSRTMGQTLTIRKGQKIVVTVAVKSPATNHDGQRVHPDHIDLIAGAVTGRIAPSSPAYLTNDTNPTAHVVTTFRWATMNAIKGWRLATVAFVLKTSMYFRLRGTGLAPDTPNQTDIAGDPLVDTLTYQTLPNPDPAQVAAQPTVTINTPKQAWADLWFYSNPIFVRVK
jgi:hypothetical protein